MKDSPLSPHLLSMIGCVAEHLPSDVESSLTAQAHRAVVSTEIVGRMVDVLVPTDLPSISLPDGPVRPIPAVIVESEPAGEILVWVRSGQFVGIEQTWFGDDPPAEWPEIDTLKFD